MYGNRRISVRMCAEACVQQDVRRRGEEDFDANSAYYRRDVTYIESRVPNVLSSETNTDKTDRDGVRSTKTLCALSHPFHPSDRL